MTITAEMVKELREQTGAAILDCKKALEEFQRQSEWDAECMRTQMELVEQRMALFSEQLKILAPVSGPLWPEPNQHSERATLYGSFCPNTRQLTKVQG